MKAYTLRLDNDILTALKHIGLRESKTVREIMLDLIFKKISANASASEQIKEQRDLKKAAELLKRLPVKKVVSAIREDRER